MVYCNRLQGARTGFIGDIGGYMATIVDVARRAQVSVATVSRVLNGKCSSSGEMAQRVLTAVAELRYAPNPAARNLRRNETRVIMILAPNITNPYYAHIISGIGDAAHRIGYSAFLFNTQGDSAQERHALERLVRRQADGAILLATEMGSDWLKPYASRFPIVQCSEYDPNVPLPCVAVDNYRAARDVMAHLIALGHTRIGLISSANRYTSTQLRQQGYRDALVEANLPHPDAYIRAAAADFNFRSGFDAAGVLLQQSVPPTALFCVSDMLALGAIACAAELGLRVPEDVTIIGFDDVEHTTMFHPYLTTVAQPCYEIGYQAMEMLGQIASHQDTPQRIILPHRLILRESAAPRAARNRAVALGSGFPCVQNDENEA